MSRVYLINGVLLLLAIASWTAFLREHSPARQRAKDEAFAASFLGRHLPGQTSEIQLLLDRSGGEPVQAFPSLTGKRLGTSEMRQIEMRVQFYGAMAQARRTAESQGWKRLGAARISSPEGRVVSLEVFETPGSQLGFLHEGRYYQADVNTKAVLDFIHDVQHSELKPTDLLGTLN